MVAMAALVMTAVMVTMAVRTATLVMATEAGDSKGGRDACEYFCGGGNGDGHDDALGGDGGN
eukprot:10680974-Alexandrium_andersonii.AAC.1